MTERARAGLAIAAAAVSMVAGIQLLEAAVIAVARALGRC